MATKYRNKKTTLDGVEFDSKREAARYSQLRMLERAGQIRDLSLQPKFTLIDSQRRADGKAERPVIYIADFMYFEGDACVVEDAKGMKTPDYVIKRKLMLSRHGITVKEV
ncbi:PF06356 domain protein [Bordetella hinzii 5132]|uniref:DUF1064 domain-containing protein n=1 Tax=Bordetella hinzii TaxID=103855 RepID=A0AAN1S0D8_9BORD|nr:DUF1064 domain-containing protein [Bordetella hinzii]AKQ59719.1 hypothetical protein ACR55_01849 [Bordetella hinzii]AZW19160.1 DUF1064 domain-containing protein [Bordetella hinzii]KCB41260.1 PF06356 domain protein [Bordetella hinzii 5132]QDJ40305.1 hypothetical protein CBR70_02845 [Bordetella hinzii]